MNPQNIIFKTKGQEVLDCSSVSVIYKTKEKTWRGFVLPYDITFEGDSKERVKGILKDMVASYEEALKKYDFPQHLKSVTLTEQQDLEKCREIGKDLFSKLKAHMFVINEPSYYAEAKLPA